MSHMDEKNPSLKQYCDKMKKFKTQNLNEKINNTLVTSTSRTLFNMSFKIKNINIYLR